MPADPNRPPDNARVRELILFVSARSKDDAKFGSIKLNKLLFYCDFLAYVKLGKSITGQEYQKLDHGPAPRRMIPTLKSLVKSRHLAIEKRPYYGRTQNVPIALRPARLALFTAEEIALVTEVLEALRHKDATAVSLLSHRFSGWEKASLGETVPYQVALVNLRKPRRKDVQKALAMREELAALRRECLTSHAD